MSMAFEVTAEDTNHREIQEELARLAKVAPHWTDAQKRESVISTLAFRWSMFPDDVAELVDAALTSNTPA